MTEIMFTHQCEDCSHWYTENQQKRDAYCQMDDCNGKLIDRSPIAVFTPGREWPRVDWGKWRRRFLVTCVITAVGSSIYMAIKADRRRHVARQAQQINEFQFKGRCANCANYVSGWCPKGAVLGVVGRGYESIRESDGKCLCPDCGAPFVRKR